MRRKRNRFFQSAAFIFCICSVVCSAAETVKSPPGHLLKFKNSSLQASIRAEIKNNFISIRLSYRAEAGHTKHRPWIWNKALSAYTTGHDVEDTVRIYIYRSSDSEENINFADIWVWRAGRSDMSEYADDMYWRRTPDSPGRKITPANVFPDTGRPPWYQRFLKGFCGEEIRRFYPQSPTKSMADVHVKSSWSEGIRHIEFRRELKTGNPDDISFIVNNRYILTVLIYDRAEKKFAVSGKVPITLRFLPGTDK